MKNWLGIEIGGTKQQIGIVSDDGKILKTVAERVELKTGAPDILQWLEREVPGLLAEFQVSGIGVGFGGVLDTARGCSICSVHVPGWERFPLKDWVEQTFSLPCLVVNDTVCGGYAELLYGSGRGCDIFAYTNIGTGCGGSLFLHGKTFDGIGVGGAYFGQTYTPDGKTGKTERMENVCSGTAVKKRLRTPGYIPRDSSLYPIWERATFKDLCEAARTGDAFSLQEIDRWSESYAYTMANVLALLSPQKISLGGGAAKDGDLLLPYIKQHTEKLEFLSSTGRYEIVLCDFQEDAVYLGAALYARDGFKTI